MMNALSRMLPLFLIFATIGLSYGRIQQNEKTLSSSLRRTSSQVVLLASQNYRGCIEPKDGNTDGDKVFLELCDKDRGGWFIEQPGGEGPFIIRNRRDPTKCLQSGYGQQINDGTKLRLLKCDTENPYQRFLYDAFFAGGGGPLKAAFRGNFCVVFFGSHADVGHDAIIIKHCYDIKQDRLPWEAIAAFKSDDERDDESDDLTLFAKYIWQDDTAKDVSGVLPLHDGVLEEGVTARDGILTVKGWNGVRLGYLQELDGAKAVLIRLEKVSLTNSAGSSVFMGGGYNDCWVGIYRDISELTREEHRKTNLVFNIGGWGPMDVRQYELYVPIEDIYMAYFDSIEYRFNGTAPANKRLSIRYNDGNWTYGGRTDAIFYPVFLYGRPEFRHDVKINDGGRADWDPWDGTLGTTSLYAVQ